MSSSEKVKRWRRNTKERIIKAMGGACCICGYNKCPNSMILHHIDPSEKDIGIGDIRANPKAWAIIVEELRKCILLCSNCHGEVHWGVAILPDNFAKFDESYAIYDNKQKGG